MEGKFRRAVGGREWGPESPEGTWRGSEILLAVREAQRIRAFAVPAKVSAEAMQLRLTQLLRKTNTQASKQTKV